MTESAMVAPTNPSWSSPRSSSRNEASTCGSGNET